MVGVLVSNRGHGNILNFQLTSHAIEEYFKLEDGLKLFVVLDQQRLLSFNVAHEIGTGVGGYTFSIDDIMLRNGVPLSAVILKK